MELKTFFAKDMEGNVLAGADVYVYKLGTITKVTGLQTAALGFLDNPFKADNEGRIEFRAPNGIYDVRVVSGQRDRTIQGIQFEQLVDRSRVFDTVADMKAASLGSGQLIETKGYHTAGDGGQARYLIKTSAEFGGAPDEYGNHSLANGNLAVLRVEGAVNLKQFGAVGDYNPSTEIGTDDAPYLNKACEYITKIGGGTVELNGIFLIDTPAVVTRGVTISGGITGLDLITPTNAADYGNLLRSSALFINPSVSISVQMAAIKSCLVMRKGLILPFSSESDALSGLSKFSGTAFAGDSYGSTFRDLLILGFNLAINSVGNGRNIFQNIKGDNNNGIRISQAYGIARITDCHFWPYTTANQDWTNKTVISSVISFTAPSTISDAENNFSDYRIGDVIKVTTTSGTNNGVYEVVTATASSLQVKQTTLTTELSSSAGETIVETRQLLTRPGIALQTVDVADWAMVTNCFSYGYFTGFNVNSCNSVTLLGCGADNISYNSTGTFPSSVGFLVNGVSNNTHLITCRAAAQEQSVVISSLGLSQGTYISGLSEHASSYASLVVNKGDIDIVGSNFRNGVNGLYIANKSSKININGLTIQNMKQDFLINTDNDNIIIQGLNLRDAANGKKILYGTGSAGPLIKTIPSAIPLMLPMRGCIFHVSGTTSFGSIVGAWQGREVILIFDDSLTVFDGTSIKMAGNFVTSAGSTLKIVSDGLYWYEVSRSIN